MTDRDVISMEDVLLSSRASKANREYALAVCVLAAAFVLRFAFDSVWGERLPYGTFFLAELIVMRLAGVGPLIFTCISGFIVADWWFVAPRYSLLIHDRVNQINALIFLLISGVLIFIALRTRRALAREQAAWTQLRQSTEQLRASEARYSSLVDNSMDAILLTDPQGAILAANPEACRLFGRSEQELCRLGRATLIVPEDQHRVLAAAQQRENHGKVRLEATFVRADGSGFTGDVSSGLFTDRDGLLRNSIVIRDITERKRAEEELARSAAIIDSSEDAIIGNALDGTVVSWNAAAERLYGYSAGQALGQSIAMLMPPETRQDLPPLLERVRRGERIRHFETERQTRDGQTIQVSLCISPVRDRSGNIVGASTIARDISERKQAEAERERLLRELQVAVANVKTLRGLLPICANCKKIRDDKGYWNQIEYYIRERSDADFTHGICPDCAHRLYGYVLGGGPSKTSGSSAVESSASREAEAVLGASCGGH